MIDIIGKRKLWYTISGVLMGMSLLALAVWRLDVGIDFTGGSLIELQYTGVRPERDAVTEFVRAAGGERIRVQLSGDQEVFIRTAPLTDERHDAIRGAFPDAEELRFESIGPTIGRELAVKTGTAILLSLIGIVIYVAWAFRKVGKDLASWKYGAAAVVALFHDVLVPFGVFAVLGRFADVEVDAAFIAAALTILGYSVNDSIIIFDRVRENQLSAHGKPFAQVVNDSVNQSFTRSVNTTCTTIFALLAVFLFGGSSIQYFALALMIGIGVGAYSSLFIAAPLLVTWHERSHR